MVFLTKALWLYVNMLVCVFDGAWYYQRFSIIVNLMLVYLTEMISFCVKLYLSSEPRHLRFALLLFNVIILS